MHKPITYAYLETTNYCNLSCTFCNRDDVVKKLKHMSLTDWLSIRRKYRTFFVDLNGVVFKNKGKYGKKNWDTKNEIIKKNVKTLLNLNSNGAQIVFVSARLEKNQNKITIELKKMGFSNFKLLLGLNHSQRILINDYFLTNPNPSSLAINIPRDDDNLDQLVKSL